MAVRIIVGGHLSCNNLGAMQAPPPWGNSIQIETWGWRIGSVTSDRKGKCWAVGTVYAKSSGGKEMARVAREQQGRGQRSWDRWQGTRRGPPVEDISPSPRKTLTALYLLHIFALATFSVRPTLPFPSNVTALILSPNTFLCIYHFLT